MLGAAPLAGASSKSAHRLYGISSSYKYEPIIHEHRLVRRNANRMSYLDDASAGWSGLSPHIAPGEPGSLWPAIDVS